ncbi:MAG TPA: hypothetical protein VHE81_09790 [Lacipirellulaceae bacterium]|nr:hypothetical protein [Lacipirellulaceae bacterium]
MVERARVATGDAARSCRRSRGKTLSERVEYVNVGINMSDSVAGIAVREGTFTGRSGGANVAKTQHRKLPKTG